MKILYDLLLMSVSGSLMFLLSSLLNRRLRRKFACRYYSMLVTSAAMFIVPLQALFSSHKMVRIPVPASDAVVSGGVPSSSVSEPALSLPQLIILIWAAVSFALICITAFKYLKVSRSLKGISAECYNDDILDVFSEVKNNMRIYREIELRVSRDLDSPLLFGVFRPIVIVPERNFTHNDLVMIFTHELTHYRHCDLAIKLMASAARCIHFFNPAVYFLSRAINEGCELCCDESVLARLDLPDKKEYGRLIISMIENPDRAMAYSTAMASPKDKIQKRLLKIIEFKAPSKLLKMLSAMAAVSVSLCSLTALGFEAAKDALPEDVAEAVTSVLSEPDAEIGGSVKETPAVDTETPEVDTETPAPTSVPTQTVTAEPEQSDPVPIRTAAATEPAAAEPTNAVDMPAAEPKGIEMPGVAYVFNPVFTDEITEVRSDNISVIYDMFAKISHTGENKNCSLKVYRINENDAEELVYDESSADTDKRSINIRFLKGEKFYIVARRINGAQRANIYVTGQ